MRRACGRDRECPGIASQPPSGPASQAPECMFTTGTPHGYRARPAEQVPRFAAPARVSAERTRRTARLAVRFSACAHIRQHAANSCRNTVYTVILHYLGTPMPFEGRGGAAEPGRVANGAVTSAEPGAERRSGRRRWRPRPTGATVRSGRRWCRREPWRLPGPACHPRPPRLSAEGGAAAGSRVRGRGPSLLP